MIIANDATVKAGAFFPQTAKKLIRAQRIAFECALPIIYLVDSSGVFLPMQDEIFPDEDDFGRIFRNNSVISAAGIPQFAAIMGNCVAGGAYLPGALRQGPHDRRQRPLSRWPVVSQSRHRPGRRSRRIGRRAACTPKSAAPSTFTKRMTPPV